MDLKIPENRNFDVMNIQKHISLVLLFLHFWCYSSDDMQKYYSSSFLKNYDAVYQSLREAHFQDISFKTPDKLTLSGLFLERPDATCNVIVCAGWLPGKKEGMATFYALLPEHCNILFFDARGHGTSEGSLWWNLWHYGKDEYKDIVGAVSWINKKNNMPIIIAGICSGAFNAAHALAYFETNKIASDHRVKGLIFDSGWASVVKIITTAPIAGIKKRIVSVLRYMYNVKKISPNNRAYKTCSWLAYYSCMISNYLCAQPLTRQYDHITNLSYKIGKITSRILFIHSYDDTYADINDARELASLASNKECWWIEKSFHGKHHLLHKDLYKEKLTAFINAVLG